MLIDQIKTCYDREKQIIDSLDWNEIDKAVQAIIRAYERDAIIYIFGNGGSAATASYYVNDFNKGFSEHKKFRTICLCDNFAAVMAVANNIGYDDRNF